MCQQLRQSLDSGCAVFALEPPNKEVLPEIEGMDVLDKKENLAVRGPRRYLDAITQEELPAELTRAVRQEELDFMQDWHVWSVVPVTESGSVMGKAPQRQVGRRQQGRHGEARGSQQVCREGIREHQIRRFLLNHAAAGSTSAVVVSCGFWEVVKYWRSQNLGSGRSEGTLARICRTQPVCGTPARSFCARYVCTTVDAELC